MNTDTWFRVVPLDPAIADAARARRTDASGGAAEIRHDADRHQCRVCLQLTKPGEEYLLLSHSPFERTTPYSERGPIFIHARSCEPYLATDRLPSQFPRNIVLRGYDRDGGIAAAALSADGSDLEDLLQAMLAQDEVEVVHARNRTYGCWMYAVRRAGPGQ